MERYFKMLVDVHNVDSRHGEILVAKGEVVRLREIVVHRNGQVEHSVEALDYRTSFEAEEHEIEETKLEVKAIYLGTKWLMVRAFDNIVIDVVFKALDIVRFIRNGNYQLVNPECLAPVNRQYLYIDHVWIKEINRVG